MVLSTAALVQLSLRGDLEARDLQSLRRPLRGRDLPRQAPAPIGSSFPAPASVTCTNRPRSTSAPAITCQTGNTAAAAHRHSVLRRKHFIGLAGVPSFISAGWEMSQLFMRRCEAGGMSGYWNDPEGNRRVLVRRPAGGGMDHLQDRQPAPYRRRQPRVRRPRQTAVGSAVAAVSWRSRPRCSRFVEVEDRPCSPCLRQRGSSALRAVVTVVADAPPAEREMIADLHDPAHPRATSMRASSTQSWNSKRKGQREGAAPGM